MSGFELETEPNGHFELILGDPPPGETPRNHLPLREDAEFLLIRQYFNDWAVAEASPHDAVEDILREPVGVDIHELGREIRVTP